MQQQLIFTNSPGRAVDNVLAKAGVLTADRSAAPGRVFVIADVNTAAYVLPELRRQSRTLADATLITVKAGDVNKNIDAAQAIWRELDRGGATRRSVVVNVGGGVVTDLGGFAAATFMRGIRAVNVPTTLLAAVDASVGGKTGINFGGIKNEIGTFTEPLASVISTCFFATLPPREMLSGYGEMLKHALLRGGDALARLLEYSPDTADIAPDRLLALIEDSVAVKREVVEADFRESGRRKVLNLGHTAGHAFEALSLKRQSPLPHGYAVAHGLVVALVLSYLRFGYPQARVHQLADYVRMHYGTLSFTCDDYPALLALMSHDKKNTAADRFNFVRLDADGRPHIDEATTPDEVRNALDIYRDLTGI